MRLPWVPRGQYELLQEQFQRALTERNEYREEATRARDALAARFGFEPVSAPVRKDLQEQSQEFEEYLKSSSFEDSTSGMIDETLVAALSKEPA